MSGRRWCPTAWFDETVPELCEDPSGFIVPVDGGFRLRSPEFADGDDIYDEALEAGQIVGFCYTEDRGKVIVRVEEDGSWSAISDVPAASHFWIPNDDVMGDTLDDLMSIAADIEPFDPGEHEIHAYYWSDDFAFRFDGERFVQCAGAS